MNVIVRKAEIRDVPDLIKLNDVFNGAGSSVETMNESLDNNQNELVYVSVIDDLVVGFICGIYWKSICYADGFQGIITELYVDEQYRRKGIATQLIKALENGFYNLNVIEITLATPLDNVAGRKFYERNGYKDRKEMVYDKMFE